MPCRRLKQRWWSIHFTADHCTWNEYTFSPAHDSVAQTSSVCKQVRFLFQFRNYLILKGTDLSEKLKRSSAKRYKPRSRSKRPVRNYQNIVWRNKKFCLTKPLSNSTHWNHLRMQNYYWYREFISNLNGIMKKNEKAIDFIKPSEVRYL